MEKSPKNTNSDKSPLSYGPDFQAVMKKIEASNAGQEKYARKQYRMSQVTAAASLLILAIVVYAAVTLIPKANVTFQNLNLIMEDLQDISAQLAQSDLDQMLTNVDHLVVTSEQSVQEAVKRLESIDIDSLNQAIHNLNDTVTPLANFFKRFQ